MTTRPIFRARRNRSRLNGGGALLSPGGHNSKDEKVKDNWDKAAIVFSFIQAIVIAVLGFYFTGRVSNAIQQKQVDLSYLKEMQPLLAKLGDAQITLPEAEAAAMGVASFSNYGIRPLVQVVQTGGIHASSAAKDALRAIGIVDSKEVCTELTTVISNNSQLYTWSTHEAAIDLLGDLNCKSAADALSDYNRRLAGIALADALQKLAVVVQSNPAPTEENVQEIRGKLDRTLAIIQRK